MSSAKMPAPIFDQLNIVSADFDATLSFYRGLGMEIEEPARTKEGEAFHASHRPARGFAL
jgi:catechol 2,3-dioxygenase-like lactoylglutathione lyase family enzyme